MVKKVALMMGSSGGVLTKDNLVIDSPYGSNGISVTDANGSVSLSGEDTLTVVFPVIISGTFQAFAASNAEVTFLQNPTRKQPGVISIAGPKDPSQPVIVTVSESM